MLGFHIISYCSLLPLLLKARIPEEHRYQVLKNFAKINRLVLTVMLADSQKNVWDDLQQGVNKEINLEFKKNFKIHSVLIGWTPGPGCCTSKITIQQISSRETNCVIHQIYIYPVDSVIHVLNNWVHLPLLLVSLFGTCTVKLAHGSEKRCGEFNMYVFISKCYYTVSSLIISSWSLKCGEIACYLTCSLNLLTCATIKSDSLQSALNTEKSLCHIAMVAKFLDDNNPKIHLTSKFALFQTSSILFNFI